MKTPSREVQLNALDRFINYVAPSYGAKRQAVRMYAQAGKFLGASLQDKLLSGWNAIEDGPDGDLLDDLETLRARSLDLYRDEPVAGAALNTFVTNAVGKGLRPSPSINATALGMSDDEAEAWEQNVELRFNAWANSQQVDVTEKDNFFSIQALTLLSRLMSGDVFAILPMIPRKGSASQLRIQLVEANRVTNPDRKADTARLAAGIETNDLGAPIRYHIQDSIESAQLTQKWTSVEARGATTDRKIVLHLFKRVRPNQRRGIPHLARVIYALKGLSKYTEAEIAAAVLASFYTVFIKSPGGDMMSGIDESSACSQDVKLGKGAIVGLGAGEEIQIANPARPNAQFDPFVSSLMNRIGMGVDLPHEVLTKRFQSSYSAARGAILEAWREFQCMRVDFEREFCQPIYETWLMEDIALGGTHAPGFFSDPILRAAYSGCEWIGQGRGHIDEEKEIKAAERKNALGVETLSEITAKFTGGDWRRKHRQLVREKNMRDRDGLNPPQGTTSRTGFGAMHNEGNADEQLDHVD